MNNFSISQLQLFSGIKAHTIRIWEQRYNALNPNRSKGNTRYYDGDQLRRLLNIVSLMDSSYKVSELCVMPDEKLHSLINSRLKPKSEESGSPAYFVSQLIAAGMCYDIVSFETVYAACVNKFGSLDTYTQVIYPLLDRIGLMWSIDAMPPAHEHFISNIIRQKLFSEIDKLPPAKSSKDTWILFLPENEFHEVGLLFSYLMIRKAGKKAVYLGTNVPLKTLVAAVKDVHPSGLMFFFVHNSEAKECDNYCATLTKHFKDLKIYISGNEKILAAIKKLKSINWIRSVKELQDQLIK
jgi:hypothetical protein